MHITLSYDLQSVSRGKDRPPDHCMSLVLMTELPTRVLYPTKSETEINDPTGPLRPYEHCFLGVAKIQT